MPHPEGNGERQVKQFCTKPSTLLQFLLVGAAESCDGDGACRQSEFLAFVLSLSDPLHIPQDREEKERRGHLADDDCRLGQEGGDAQLRARPAYGGAQNLVRIDCADGLHGDGVLAVVLLSP